MSSSHWMWCLLQVNIESLKEAQSGRSLSGHSSELLTLNGMKGDGFSPKTTHLARFLVIQLLSHYPSVEPLLVVGYLPLQNSFHSKASHSATTKPSASHQAVVPSWGHLAVRVVCGQGSQVGRDADAHGWEVVEHGWAFAHAQGCRQMHHPYFVGKKSCYSLSQMVWWCLHLWPDSMRGTGYQRCCRLLLGPLWFLVTHIPIVGPCWLQATTAGITRLLADCWTYDGTNPNWSKLFRTS